MAFSSTGVQSGTDSDLSGTSVIAGQSESAYSAGGINVVSYTTPTQIDVTGDLTISPESENLTCPNIIVRNGATLRISGRIETNGLFTRYSENLAIRVTRVSTSFQNNPMLLLENGATVIHEGGLIIGSAPIVSNNADYITAGAIVVIDVNSAGTPQWRHQGTTFSLPADIPDGESGLIYRGADFTVIRGNIPPRYNPQGITNGAFGWSGSTPNIDFPVPEPNLSDLSTTRHISFWSGCRPILENGTYTVIRSGAHVSGNATAYGVHLVETDITINPQDLAGDTVQARIYRDADVKGKQVNYDNEGHFVDGTSNIITNVDSNDGTFRYRTRVNAVNTGNGDPINTGNYAWGYYGDDDTDEGSLFHTFRLRSYGLTEASFTIREGRGAVNLNAVLLPNTSVVSSRADAENAFSQLTIDKTGLVVSLQSSMSSQLLHDALDFFMTLENQQDIDYFFSVSGDAITLTDGWVIEPASVALVQGSVIDANQNTTLSEQDGALFSVFTTSDDRDSNSNALASDVATFGTVLSTLPSPTVFVSAVFGATRLPFTLELEKGANSFSAGVAGQISALSQPILETRNLARELNSPPA